jgi:hypothetical protein
MTKFIHVWKGRYIDWRDMIGKRVLLPTGYGDAQNVTILGVEAPKHPSWDILCPEEALVQFKWADGDVGTYKLSEFVTKVRDLDSPN